MQLCLFCIFYKGGDIFHDVQNPLSMSAGYNHQRDLSRGRLLTLGIQSNPPPPPPPPRSQASDWLVT